MSHVLSDVSEKSMSELAKNEKRQRWVYLGGDITTCNKINKNFGEENKVKTDGLLYAISKKLKEKYVEYVGEMSKRYDSMDWWGTQLSEKSPFLSKVFINICYLSMFFEIIKKNSDVIFFVENNYLRETIIKNSNKKDIQIETVGSVGSNKIKNSLESVKNKLIFIANNCYKIFISKYILRMQDKIKTSSKTVMMHTFVTKRSFDKNGNFRESYFGDLRNKLKERGNEVIVIPSMWGLSYSKAVENLNKNKDSFLLPHSFLSFSDIFKSAFRTIKKIQIPVFEGMEISPLVRMDMELDIIGRRFKSNLLFYYLIKRMREKGLELPRLIYTFENQAWEKILLVGIKEFYPNARTIAYQHATFTPMHLNYLFSKEEQKIVPLPDRIITNGTHYEKKLKEFGYPREIVVKGGAIRYNSGKKQLSYPEVKNEKPKILVTSSIDECESTEFIWKVFQTFSNKDYEIVIKCHPYLPFEKISNLLNLKLPSNFKISNKPVPELLKEADILMYTSSTTCVEALSMGKPAMHISSDLLLNLDILEDFGEEARVSSSNTKDILENTKKIIEDKRKNKKWREIVGEIFGEVDDSTYGLFI